MADQGQLTYPFYFDAAYAGMTADNWFDFTESDLGLEQIDFGLGLVTGQGQVNSTRKPKQNQAVITFTGALITANQIDALVNGVAISPVTFMTSDAATRAAVAAAIVATLLAQGILATSSVGGVGVYTITITATDDNAIITGVLVTLGASQETATVAQAETQAFRGVAQHMHLPTGAPITTTVSGYQAKDMVNVFRKGRIYVPVMATVLEGETAYLNVADSTKLGQFTNVSTGNVNTKCQFRSAGTAGKLAVLELNLPQA